MPPIVLLDTNVIFACHDAGCWPAFAGSYRVETVEACIRETQNGKENFPPEKRIDEATLVKSFQKIHAVEDEQLALVLLSGGTSLHYGEQHLWAHALTRTDAWLICGPDKASMEFGFDNGCRQNLACLETLMADRNIRAKPPLRSHYGRRWHDKLMTDCTLKRLS